jgi:amino acid permease
MIVIAVALVVIGIVYFTTTAGNLPSFFPGRLKGSTHYHTKHGIAAISLAVVALIGAWFTTAPSSEGVKTPDA